MLGRSAVWADLSSRKRISLTGWSGMLTVVLVVRRGLVRTQRGSRAQWWPERKAQLLRASQDLHGLGQSALNNADEQDKASGTYGSGTTGPPTLSPRRLAELRSEASALESPADISKWWRGLSQAERDGLVAGDPHFVGNTDGIPPDKRYEANRTSIGSYVDESHDGARCSSGPNRAST